MVMAQRVLLRWKEQCRMVCDNPGIMKKMCEAYFMNFSTFIKSNLLTKYETPDEKAKAYCNLRKERKGKETNYYEIKICYLRDIIIGEVEICSLQNRNLLMIFEINRNL